MADGVGWLGLLGRLGTLGRRNMRGRTRVPPPSCRRKLDKPLGEVYTRTMTERDGELRGPGVIPSSSLALWVRGKKAQKELGGAVWEGLTKRAKEKHDGDEAS